MSFPDGSSYLITEWLIDGVWTDMSPRVRGQIELTRGRQSEQGVISPTLVNYTADNIDNALNNRNPNSVYYRKIPQGIQVRHLAGTGDNHVYMRYRTYPPTGNSADTTSVRTADKASLDITGDLEVRVEVNPHSWRPEGPSRVMILASKWATPGNQRSWALYLTYLGRIILATNPTGASVDTTTSMSNASIPVGSDRLAIKATIDVDNGAGGRTVSFYTAPSINGTYTLLGTAVTTTGTTSIFSSSAEVVVGGGATSIGIFTTGAGFGGKFYGFQLYNGIGGSRVANPDFSTWSLDTTSQADSHGNTWALSGQARVSSPRVRFWGELTSITHSEDKSGNDGRTPIIEADLLERLGAARIPQESPLFLNISKRSGILGYWPLEDGEKSEFIASGLSKGRPGRPYNVQFGQSTGLPGSKQEAELTNQASRIKLSTGRKGTNTGISQVVFFFKVGDISTLIAPSQFVGINFAGGTMRNATFFLNATTWRLRLVGDSYLTPLVDSTAGFGTGVLVTNEWIAMRLSFRQNGANVDWEWAWYQQGNPTFWGTSGSYAGTSVGYATAMEASAQANSAFSGTKISHFVLSEVDLGFSTGDSTWSQAIEAYAGEGAVERIDRVSTAAGIYCEVTGDQLSSARCGAQPIDTPLNVMRNAATADGGILYGLRDAYGIGYRTRQDSERRIDAALSYSASHLAEEPDLIDDNQVINAFTASRSSGSSAVAEITSGPNSTALPPAGIGYKPAAADFNLFDDSTLQDVANLRARFGSQDQARIPSIAVGLHRTESHSSSAIGQKLAGLDLGDTLTIGDWPFRLAPRTQFFLVQGYREFINKFEWSIWFNATPSEVYRTGMFSTPEQPAGNTRYGSRSSTLSVAVNTSATTLVVQGTATYLTKEVWTSNAARYPLDIEIEGERITLNNPPTGSTSPQTFNGVTRSVNGVVKSHGIGAAVDIFDKTYYGM